MQAAAKVLIVDDARFLRMVLRDMLEKVGCHVVGEAEDGQQALSLYPEVIPDLVFLDMFLPNVDGLSILKEFFKLDPYAAVIACSSNNKEEIVRQVMLTGARDYLTKPLDEVKTMLALRRALIAKPGKPQTLIEELMAWFDLGELLIQSGMLNRENLNVAKQGVAAGKYQNLQRALLDCPMMDEEYIHIAKEESHRDVGLALVLLKSRVITLQQLRYALVLVRNSGRRLGFTLVEQGFCTQAQITEALKQVPPYNRTEL